MTGLAVSCESNVLLLNQVFDVLLIKRLSESISMSRLTPLRVHIRMAFAASSGRNKITRLDEVAVEGRCIRGAKRRCFPEAVIVILGDELLIIFVGQLIAFDAER